MRQTGKRHVSEKERFPHHFVLSLLCQAMRLFIKLPGFDTLTTLHCVSNANKELKFMVASVTYCVSS